MTDAIIVFGSSARGDQDRWSDCDRVLIGAQKKERHTLSDTVYTWSQIEDIVSSRSLFAVHLALEGVIAKDTPDKKLQNLLSRARLKDSYASELNEILLKLKLLRSKAQPGLPSYAFVLKRVYSLFRGACMYYAAQEKSPSFSIAELLNFISQRIPKLSRTAEQLARLRAFKILYERDPSVSVPFAPDSFEQVLGALDDCIRFVACLPKH